MKILIVAALRTQSLIRSLAVCCAVSLTAALPALLATAPAAPAAAGSLDDLVRIDVLDGGLTSRGTYQAALRLTLADGWKTYWRTPGDAGIPPQFNWRRSRNVSAVTIIWPTPEVFELSGLRSIGYKHELVLPIEITPAQPGKPVRLKGEIEFGLCKDICIPASLSFDQPLDANATRNPAIIAALAQRPYSASEAGVRAATCRLSPTGDGSMRIEARITMPSAGGREVVIIEPGSPKLWASQTETRRSGGVLIATSDLTPVSGTAFSLDRSRVRITVLGQRHAVDIIGCTAPS